MKLEMPILRLFLICKKSKTKRHRQKSKGANEGLDWGKDERNLGKSLPWLLTSNTTSHHSQGACFYFKHCQRHNGPEGWVHIKSSTQISHHSQAACYWFKKGINAEGFGKKQVSAKSVHRKQMFTWTFCKCTLFKHEIEEASEQLGATTGWITINGGHKCAE